MNPGCSAMVESADMDQARRITQLDRQIGQADRRAATLRVERRELRRQLREAGVGWAAIGALSGVSPAAIQKDLQDAEQRARSNEQKRTARRVQPPEEAEPERAEATA